MEDKEKKIIIDESWKDQAEKEKEILSKQQEKEEKKSKKPLPKGDFPGLVNMLVTNIFFALGLYQLDSQQEKREPDFDMAKYNIDMLETLREKTKGNLDENEIKMLENIISEVQKAFVKVAGV